MKFLVLLALFAIAPALHALGVQTPNADPICPGLKFEIGVPDDVVRPQPSVLLEMKLTNVSRSEVWLPAGSPDFWSYEFELRDAQGNLVPRTAEWMHALSERPGVTTLNVSMPLAAGASLTKTVMLEKLFELRNPGQYTLRISFVSFACGNTGIRVTSNPIQLALPSNHPSTSHAGISVQVSAIRSGAPVGWAVPLDIVIQNNSGHPLRWAADDPPNTAPDEFLTGVEVLDSRGRLCAPPKRPNPNWSFSRFRVTASMVAIPSGMNAEQIVLLGDLFDIDDPGRYRAKVKVWDPKSNQLIESNLISFEVEDTSSPRAVPKQPLLS